METFSLSMPDIDVEIPFFSGSSIWMSAILKLVAVFSAKEFTNKFKSTTGSSSISTTLNLRSLVIDLSPRKVKTNKSYDCLAS